MLAVSLDALAYRWPLRGKITARPYAATRLFPDCVYQRGGTAAASA